MKYQDGSLIVDFPEQDLNPPEFTDPMGDTEARTIDLCITEDYYVEINYDIELGWELCTVQNVIVHDFATSAVVSWQAVGKPFDTFRELVLTAFNAEVPEPKVWE